VAVLERALAPVMAAGWWNECRWLARHAKGFRFLNEILVELLPDSGPASR
jgi:hypothetical protein